MLIVSVTAATDPALDAALIEWPWQARTEIERSEDDGRWVPVADVAEEHQGSVGRFTDCEARRGVPLRYRARPIQGETIGRWRESAVITLAPMSGEEIVIDRTEPIEDPYDGLFRDELGGGE